MAKSEVELLKDVEHGDDTEASNCDTTPVWFFGYMSRAILREFHSLCHDVSSLSFTIQQLSGRFAFFRLVTKYHNLAKNKILLPKLEEITKSTPLYLIPEDESDLLFAQLFDMIHSNSIENEKEEFNLRKGIWHHTRGILDNLRQFMLAEKNQLLSIDKNLSFEEQALLVWNYISCIPVVLVEKILPWFMSSLSSRERESIMNLMQKIFPGEEQLHEAFLKWVKQQANKKNAEFLVIYENSLSMEYIGEAWHTHVGVTMGKNNETTRAIVYTNSICKRLKVPVCDIARQSVQNMAKSSLIRITWWRNAIKKELHDIVNAAYKLRHGADVSNITAFIDRLHIIVEICVFHSALKDNKLCQTIQQKSRKHTPIVNDDAEKELSTKDFQNLLDRISAVGTDLSSYEVFCQFCIQTDMLIERIKNTLFEKQPKVFSLARDTSSNDDSKLFYQSLCVMPLGLLERALPWLFERTPEVAEEILQSMHLIAPSKDISLVDLLMEQASRKCNKDFVRTRTTYDCLGKSRKISTNDVSSCCGSESNLQCDSALGYIDVNEKPVQQRQTFEKVIGSSAIDVLTVEKPIRNPMTQIGQASNSNAPRFLNNTLSLLKLKRKIPYSHSYLLKHSTLAYIKKEFTPIDNVFLCHKAIYRDLEYLDMESSRLQCSSTKVFHQFTKRFFLARDMYLSHSKAEDEFVFPALTTKEVLKEVTKSYSRDLEEEKRIFEEISEILFQLTKMHDNVAAKDLTVLSEAGNTLHEDQVMEYYQMSSKLQSMCRYLRATLERHLVYKEIKIWPLLNRHFDMEEQYKIIGYMIGNMGGEMLQELLERLTTALTQKELSMMFKTLLHTTRNTNFTSWLNLWWKGSPIASASSQTSIPPKSPKLALPPSGTPDSLKVLALYLFSVDHKLFSWSEKVQCEVPDSSPSSNHDKPGKRFDNIKDTSILRGEITNSTTPDMHTHTQLHRRTGMDWKDIMRLDKNELQYSIWKISSDSSLDPQQKGYLMQTLLSSGFMASFQQQPEKQHCDMPKTDCIPGKYPSYRDEENLIFGCKHYKRNCKVVAACCGKLFTCRFCHDKVSDHEMDRKATEHMMCMACLTIQPISQNCKTPSCKGLAMARYFCNICKLFDDERKVYHCPFCNLCRVGQGLGVDYSHCMKCNGCLSKSLLVGHKCREKVFESNCPICNEYCFTSSKTVKALPCGHTMHSSCFKDYTCEHYTCPICSKSMGNMTVYFTMLDAILANECDSEGCIERTQDIYCNDCETKGKVTYHPLYHKCDSCGSYNARVI